MRTVHAFNLQERFSKRYNAILETCRVAELKNAWWNGIAAGSFMLFLYSIFGLVFWYGSRLVIHGTMTGGSVLVAFFSLLIGMIY